MGNAKIVDITKQLGETFNLEAKLEMYKDVMYFCSKYLVYAEGAYRFVPDPIKSFTKLGRFDMYCKEHVDEYYISFVDNMRVLRNLEIREILDKHTVKRHRKHFINEVRSVRPIIDYLVRLTYDMYEFRKCFRCLLTVCLSSISR